MWKGGVCFCLVVGMTVQLALAKIIIISKYIKLSESREGMFMSIGQLPCYLSGCKHMLCISKTFLMYEVVGILGIFTLAT